MTHTIVVVIHFLSTTNIIRTAPTSRFASIIMNRLSTSIQSNAKDSSTQQKNQEIDDCETSLLPVGEVFSFVEEEPEDAAEAVCEPARR